MHTLWLINYGEWYIHAGADPGGLWGLKTPPPEIYQRSQKSGVLV